MANAGRNVMHNNPSDNNKREVQRYITNLFFVEISLLSGIVSSIGMAPRVVG